MLRDGSTAHVRPIRPDDELALLEFLRALPSEDRRLRFFSLSTDLARTAHEETLMDDQRSLGLLATVGGSEGRIVAHAFYAPCGDDVAEVAFAVASHYQGQGLASLLLGQLAEVASAQGIHTFEALVLPENLRMLAVLRDSGFPVKKRFASGVVELSFPTSLTPEALARFDQREEQAAASALRTILEPRSVAVIGASRRPGSVGAAVVRNLLAAGFPGSVYPINPSAESIQGLACYPTVEAVPGDVDLAVIAVPAAAVVGVAEACGRKGVRSLVVLSAGFAEAGDREGQRRQAELVRTCRAAGMRIVGPNCIGVINTDPRAPLNATFGPSMPAAGPLGLASQSGALGLAAVDFASARGLGFSSIVSMGNKADISGNDLLGYWHTDPRTQVILLYLESFGNPRRFGRLARAIGRTRPIIAIKSGRSAVGARASASHTGALLAASDVTVDALFRQAGVIRTDSLADMLDVAQLLAFQPLPGGGRVAIVTNVGGPGIMGADACEAHGLDVPPLADATRQRLRSVLPGEASVANPVDMLATATADHYRAAVLAVADDPGIDAVVVIFVAPLTTGAEDVAQALGRVADDVAQRNKPLLAVFVSPHQPTQLLAPSGRRVPAYALPEPAIAALAHAVRYASWRATSTEATELRPDLRHAEADLLIAEALRDGAGWLGPDAVQRLLACYGLPLVEQRVVRSAEAAAAAAAELGGEVALKVVLPGPAHKSDLGGVRLHLAGPDAVRGAAEELARRVRSATGQMPKALLVQRMAGPGVELLVGLVNDAQFGPTVACGAGGLLVELLRDVSVRLAPISRSDAAGMLRELRSFPLLTGFRGSPPCAVDALEDVLVRLGALAEAHPEIAELDCNPVVVTPGGALIVDARVRVAPLAPSPPLGARGQASDDATGGQATWRSEEAART